MIRIASTLRKPIHDCKEVTAGAILCAGIDPWQVASEFAGLTVVPKVSSIF
jgi:hypothetical protein